MKRNYSFRTDKFSLFLFGMGAGLLSMVPATYAQTQLLPLAESVPKIRSPRELMPATTWNRPSIAEADKLVVRSPDTLNHVIVNPDLTKTLETLEVQENVIPVQSPSRSNSDAIRVDSTVFDLDSKKPADTVQSDVVQDDITPPNQLEFKQLQPLKFPVNWNDSNRSNKANKLATEHLKRLKLLHPARCLQPGLWKLLAIQLPPSRFLAQAKIRKQPFLRSAKHSFESQWISWIRPLVQRTIQFQC